MFVTTISMEILISSKGKKRTRLKKDVDFCEYNQVASHMSKSKIGKMEEILRAVL